MQLKVKPFVFLLVSLSLWVPTAAYSSDINVKAGNVRVRTTPNGRVFVDMEGNRIELDNYRNRTNSWWKPLPDQPRRYRNCTNRTYQRSTQTTRVNGHERTRTMSSRTCR
ncbi:MAG: hypothetical protein RI580_14205 [Halothece sp. Uz-M2-17]|nr:hypothetical protein [Halothece sp. Uz-M2-17]